MVQICIQPTYTVFLFATDYSILILQLIYIRQFTMYLVVKKKLKIIHTYKSLFNLFSIGHVEHAAAVRNKKQNIFVD